MLKTLTDNNFHSEVRESEQPVVILFSGSWCQPCKAYKPIFEKISEHKKTVMKFMIADMDQCPVVSSDLVIRSVPSTVMFENGILRNLKPGTMKLYELREWIDDSL